MNINDFARTTVNMDNYFSPPEIIENALDNKHIWIKFNIIPNISRFHIIKLVTENSGPLLLGMNYALCQRFNLEYMQDWPIMNFHVTDTEFGDKDVTFKLIQTN